jgi:DNA-binding transcriptional LysR family regulator
MDRFLSIEAFVAVGETRSFAETARRMRLSKSAITSHSQQPEVYVGASPLHPNTRKCAAVRS